MLEINKIHQGDCLELMKEMPDNSVDLIIADPPYGMSFQSNYRKTKFDKLYGDGEYVFNQWFPEMKRVCKGAIYIFCRWDNFSQMDFGFNKPSSVICWVKNNWSMGDLEHEHGRQWEAICFYPQKEHKFKKRIPDIIHCNRTGNLLHPTQKPVNLIKEIIQCNEGDVVLDPFMGSGTTAVACKQLGRSFIGFEIEQRYVDIANKRLAQKRLNIFG